MKTTLNLIQACLLKTTALPMVEFAKILRAAIRIREPIAILTCVTFGLRLFA